MGMKGKLTASFITIAAVLLVSCMISVLEFVKVDSFASDMVSDSVQNFARLRKLSESTFDYNQDLLTVIGIDTLTTLPEIDSDAFAASCDTLAWRLNTRESSVLADSLKQNFLRFYQDSRGLETVLSSDFIDTKSWYFSELQPGYKQIQNYVDLLNAEIYKSLDNSSKNFDIDFFRSIIPGIVAIGVAILMLLLLLFYLIIYYARPLDKMISGMESYKSFNKKYNYEFEGDDQLSHLNSDLVDLTEENRQLRKRISELRLSARQTENKE